MTDLAEADAPTPPTYAVPAVEKALDVLEYLASSGDPVTQNQIAKGTGWSVSQVFRILSVLEKRGYIGRDQQSGLYSSTLRMFRVAHQQEPISTLVNLTRSPLRQLAAEIEQSCNIGYRDGDVVVIVAQASGSADFGFHVRVGASFPLEGSPTGDLFLAFENPDGSLRADATPSLCRRLTEIRDQGYVEVADNLHSGVTDIVFPILDRDGTILAALTVPYVATSYSKRHVNFVRDAARRTALSLSTLLGGERD